MDMMDSWQTSSPTSDVSAHALSNLDRSTLEDSPLQPVIGSSVSDFDCCSLVFTAFLHAWRNTTMLEFSAFASLQAVLPINLAFSRRQGLH